MLTTEQLDNWFTYHAPTEETAPKYAAIREAEDKVVTLFFTLQRNVMERHGHATERLADDAYGTITTATRTLAEVIDANAPDCDDKTAAIRCVRLARNAANEVVAALLRGDLTSEDGLLFVLDIMRAEAIKARWQANSAIACGGK